MGVKAGSDGHTNMTEKALLTKQMHVSEGSQTEAPGKKSMQVKVGTNMPVPLKHPGAKPSFLKATSTLPGTQKNTTKEKD